MAASTLSAHTFTSKDEATFQGELLSVSEDSVTIKRKEDAKEFTIQKSRFTQKDLKYFEEWKEKKTEDLDTSVPEIPKSVEAAIKEAARAKWPGNYEMQVFHYENNVEAWQTIQLLRKNLIRPSDDETERKINEEMSLIFVNAEKKWAGNYEMQLFQIKNQFEAFMKMEGIEK